MEQSNKFEILTRTFSNPTKIGIIMLLAEHNRMTVTEMSKYLDVSKSNLYHFVAQLVSDGVLNEPEVIPKKNYVEKYYTVNPEMVGASDEEEWEDYLRDLDDDGIRNMLGSALMGYSMNLKMAAEQIYNASDEDVAKLKDWILTKNGWLSFSSLGEKSSEKAGKGVSALMKDLMERAGHQEDHQEEAVSRLLIIYLPFLGKTLPQDIK